MKFAFALVVAGAASAHVLLPGILPQIPEMELGDIAPPLLGENGAGLPPRRLGEDDTGLPPLLIGEDGAGQWKMPMLGAEGHGLQWSSDQIRAKCVEKILQDIDDLETAIENIKQELATGSTEEIISAAVAGLEALQKLRKTIDQCGSTFDESNTQAMYDAQMCRLGLANASIDAMSIFKELSNVQEDNQFAMMAKMGKLIPVFKQTKKLSGVCGINRKGCVEDLIALGLALVKVEQELQMAISTANVEQIISALGDLVSIYPLAKTVTSECEGFDTALALPKTHNKIAPVNEECVKSISALVLDGESTMLEIARAVKSKDEKAVEDILNQDIPKLACDVYSVMSQCNQD